MGQAGILLVLGNMEGVLMAQEFAIFEHKRVTLLLGLGQA